MSKLAPLGHVVSLLLFFSTTLAALAQPSATLTANSSSYEPGGGTLTFTSTLSYTGLTPSVYAFSVQLPTGWKFVSQSLGPGLSASPAPMADDNLLEWAFSGFPANQTSWTFVVSYPGGMSGAQTVTVVTAQYRSPTTNLSVPAITLSAAVPTAPLITGHPQTQTVTAGESVTFSVSTSGSAPMTYQWSKDGSMIVGATSSTFTISSARASDSGVYTVQMWNNDGTVISNAATLTVNRASTTLSAIATRAYCASGNGVAIGGFVIAGDSPKQVLMRAVGPSLVTQGLPQNEALSDPAFTLHRGSDTLASVDDWGQNTNSAAIVSAAARLGAAPLASSDTKSAALLITLNPGAYTFVVRGNNNTSGVVLIEIYDAD